MVNDELLMVNDSLPDDNNNPSLREAQRRSNLALAVSPEVISYTTKIASLHFVSLAIDDKTFNN